MVPGLYALGPAEFVPCAGAGVAPEAFLVDAAAALALLDEVLPEEANAAYEATAARLPCLSSPLDPTVLAQFQFHRAIAALTRAVPDQPLGLAAFTAAITADPGTRWNEDYAALPRSVFFEGKVALLTAQRAHVWLVEDPGTRIWLEGREVQAVVDGTEVLAGPHLAHIQRGAASWTGVIDLPSGGEVVLGGDGLWDVVRSSGGPRSSAARRALALAYRERVLLTRPGAFAALEPDGTLGAWSDEGPYRTRFGVELAGDYVFYERHIESPPVDIANPSDGWGLPVVSGVVRFHPILSAHLGVGLAASGPFLVGSERAWRLMAVGKLGVDAERPTGRIRPGATFDLAAMLPGKLTVAGEPTRVVLVGPLLGATVACRLTESVWLSARAGGGWLGSSVVSGGLALQLRFPPPRG